MSPASAFMENTEQGHDGAPLASETFFPFS